MASPPPRRLVIASRQSALAMWQANHVQALLRQRYPSCEVSILSMTTRGDQILDRSLSKIGGKGLFTKELEIAIEDRRADLAVHSLKDVPMELPPGFVLAATLKREDPRDAFVSSRYANMADLPAGARVGTSSLRRAAQVRHNHPRLQILELRGNVNTRLGRLDAGEYDAIILAAAGLKRLGMADRIRALLPPDESLPAVGQGVLARGGDRECPRAARGAAEVGGSDEEATRGEDCGVRRADARDVWEAVGRGAEQDDDGRRAYAQPDHRRRRAVGFRHRRPRRQVQSPRCCWSSLSRQAHCCCQETRRPQSCQGRKSRGIV